MRAALVGSPSYIFGKYVLKINLTIGLTATVYVFKLLKGIMHNSFDRCEIELKILVVSGRDCMNVSAKQIVIGSSIRIAIYRFLNVARILRRDPYTGHVAGRSPARRPEFSK